MKSRVYLLKSWGWNVFYIMLQLLACLSGIPFLIHSHARGEIVDVILNPPELPIADREGAVKLEYLLLYILMKMDRTRAGKLEGLDKHVIPLESTKQTVMIQVQISKGKKVCQTAQRRQFSMTPAYAFTDYRVQGQTILSVLVDIGQPPTGMLSLFNLSVALSRSSGHSYYGISMWRNWWRAMILSWLQKMRAWKSLAWRWRFGGQECKSFYIT